MSSGRKKNIMLRKIQNYFNGKSQTWFNGLCTWIGLISGSLAILEVLIYKTPIDKYLFKPLVNLLKEYKSFFISLIFVSVFLITVLLVLKYRNSAINKMRASSRGTEEIVTLTIETMDLFDSIEQDINRYQNWEECSEECYMLKQAFANQLSNSFITYSHLFLDKLQDIMEKFISYDLSFCCKMVYIDKDEKYVFTLARSKGTVESRIYGGISPPARIEDNSDFKILDEANHKNKRNAYFYVSDLHEYNKLLKKISNGNDEYHNSNPKWSDYYSGTMVVPISKSVTDNKRKCYKTLGFLCADSLSKKAFTDKQKTINLKIFQAYANLFGPIAYKYYELINELEGDIKNDTKKS